MSPPAKRLIERLLQAEPTQRPNMEQVLHDEFFTAGFSIDSLSPVVHKPSYFNYHFSGKNIHLTALV